MAVPKELWFGPGYAHCLTSIYSTFTHYIRTENLTADPREFLKDMMHHGSLSRDDVILGLSLAVVMTLVRWLLTVAILRPFARYMKMLPENIEKFPESFWKMSFTACTWSYSYYALVYSKKYNFFYDPNSVWMNWYPGLPLPWDIYTLYMAQFGFYLHSVYGTLYMDHWRKDSHVMLFHHLLTTTLLAFSYIARYHKIGMLVLFVHDITDIFLEFTKCNVYMKNRGGKYYAIHDRISTVGFLIFAAAWFYFRLYLFPQKILYSTGYGVVKHGPHPLVPFYVFFNVLLWMLQFLNVYWFMFILNFIYKVATGQIKEIDDTREEEVLERINKKPEEQRYINGTVNGNAKGASAGNKKKNKGRPKLE